MNDDLLISEEMEKLAKHIEKVNAMSDAEIMKTITLISASLIEREPFWAMLLARIDKIIYRTDPSVMTCAAGISDSSGTPRFVLYFNPYFFLKYKYEEQVAILIHELMHICNFHVSISTAEQDKAYIASLSDTIGMSHQSMHEIFNWGMDIAINQQIENIPDGLMTREFINNKLIEIAKEQGKETPELLKPGLSHLEYIRDLLKSDLVKSIAASEKQAKEEFESLMKDFNDNKLTPKEFTEKLGELMKKNGGRLPADCHPILTKDFKNKIGSGEMAEKFVNNIVSELVSDIVTKYPGIVPGTIKDAITKLTATPTLNWTHVLKRYIGSIKAPFRKTMLRRNRRAIDRLDLRGRMPDMKLNLLIAIDTSGSISEAAFNRFINEINSIIEVSNVVNLTLIDCDMEIQKVTEVTTLKKITLPKRSGYGGTSFVPVFRYWKDHRFKHDILIYLTDGYGDRIPKEYTPPASKKVIWVVTGSVENLSEKKIGIKLPLDFDD